MLLKSRYSRSTFQPRSTSRGSSAVHGRRNLHRETEASSSFRYPHAPLADSMKIFLSYASEDRAVAEAIHLALSAQGHDVFFDRDDLPPGDEFNIRIRRAIEQTDLFVFLVSAQALDAGSYTLNELDIAEKSWSRPAGHAASSNASADQPRSAPGVSEIGDTSRSAGESTGCGRGCGIPHREGAATRSAEQGCSRTRSVSRRGHCWLFLLVAPRSAPGTCR